MNIVVEGKLPENRTIRFLCDYCGCIWETDPQSCDRTIASIEEFRNNGYLAYSKCPVCGYVDYYDGRGW